MIDIGWGLGFIVIALVSYMHHLISFKNTLLLIVVAIWGLRLAIYIIWRSRGKLEDPRYTKFGHEWQPRPNLQAYFKVFLFQGLLMMIVNLPLSVGMAQNSQHITILNWLGLMLWIVYNQMHYPKRLVCVSTQNIHNPQKTTPCDLDSLNSEVLRLPSVE